ncbi:MAG: efflux RND transporter periplasmic adaptor subunit [Acidobacteriota bacterium]
MFRKIDRSFTLLILIISVLFMTNGCSGLDSNDQTFSLNGKPVDSAEVVLGSISLKISGSGFLLPAQTTNLSYQDISGPLQKLYVKQNDYVKAGQLIAEIDPKSVIDRLADQRFIVAGWPTKMAQMNDSLRNADYNMKQAKATLEAAIKKQETNEKAEDTADINENIQNNLNRGSLSNQYEQSKSNYNNALSAKQLAANEYEKQKKEYQSLDPSGMESTRYNQLAMNYQLIMEQWPIRLKQLDDNIRIAQINMEQAKASLDTFDKINKNKDSIKEKQKLTGSLNETLSISQLKLQYDQAVSACQNAKWNKDLSKLEYERDKLTLTKLQQAYASRVLKSPVSGKVIFVESIEPLEMVGAGQVLVRISDSSNAVFRMPFVDARYLNGDEQVGLEIENKSYQAGIYIPQPGDQLTEGSRVSNPNMIYLKFKSEIPAIEYNKMARAEVTISKNDTMIIPKSCLRQENDKYKAGVIQGNNITAVEVERGLANDQQVEILSGLSPGQKVKMSY